MYFCASLFGFPFRIGTSIFYAMKHYNPLKTPDPEDWLALDEMERIYLVRKYHRQKRIGLPNITAHVLFHVVVENQIAAGDSVVTTRILERLISEGLDRHEAIHEIGSVLSKYIFNALKGTSVPDLPKAYFAELETFTA